MAQAIVNTAERLINILQALLLTLLYHVMSNRSIIPAIRTGKQTAANLDNKAPFSEISKWRLCSLEGRI